MHATSTPIHRRACLRRRRGRRPTSMPWSRGRSRNNPTSVTLRRRPCPCGAGGAHGRASVGVRAQPGDWARCPGRLRADGARIGATATAGAPGRPPRRRRHRRHHRRLRPSRRRRPCRAETQRARQRRRRRRPRRRHRRPSRGRRPCRVEMQWARPRRRRLSSGASAEARPRCTLGIAPAAALSVPSPPSSRSGCSRVESRNSRLRARPATTRRSRRRPSGHCPRVVRPSRPARGRTV